MQCARIKWALIIGAFLAYIYCDYILRIYATHDENTYSERTEKNIQTGNGHHVGTKSSITKQSNPSPRLGWSHVNNATLPSSGNLQSYAKNLAILETHKNKKPDRNYPIPNIIHYIWYNNKSVEISFDQMLSIMGVHKIQQPERIFFHTNNEPHGELWNKVKEHLTVIYRVPTHEVFGHKLDSEHYEMADSNIDRLKLLYEYGGIYMDTDVLFIQPVNELRTYKCVVGWEKIRRICGGIILCSVGHPFLRLWLNGFITDFRPNTWSYNTGEVPSRIANNRPHMVHVVQGRLNQPNWTQLDRILGNTPFQWNRNFVLHTWKRLWKNSDYASTIVNEESIKVMDNAYGRVARNIYFGSPNIRNYGKN